MKILLFLTKGVELIEMSAFVDVFGWNRSFNHSDTQIVTCGFREEIVTTFDVKLKVDLLIDDVVLEEYDALAIPGGFGNYGFYEDAYNEKFLDLIRAFNDAGKYIATVCVASLPLGKSGILVGKRATTYHLMEGRRQRQLEAFGAIIDEDPIVTDGNIISSWCPSTAAGVAFKLLELLTSKEEADEIRTIMGY